MARTLRAAVAAALLFVVALASATPVSGDVASGVVYLASTQDSFGGWDGDPTTIPEFTTSEVILAVAAAAQTGASWSTTEAFDAVDAIQNGGVSPLDYMDVAAESPPAPLTPGKAAKWIVNVAIPLGLDPAAFDPAGDGNPVDLVAIMGVPGPDGSFGTGANFNGAAYAALASFLLDGAVPSSTVAYLLDAQTPSGGWSFDGNPATDPDTDSTGFTLEALVAAGVAPDDPAVQSALVYLARDVSDEGFGDAGYDNTAGYWLAFGTPSPEGTSRALLGISALGYDVSTSCWRDTARPDLAGTAYTSPVDAIAGLQQLDGSWPSFLTAFTTAQAIQGLEDGTWRPLVTAAAQTCDVPQGSAPPAPAAPIALVLDPTFTG